MRVGAFAILAGALVAGCGKDPGLKASKSECEAACSRASALTERDPGFGAACTTSCIDSTWTVGDVACVRDAKNRTAAEDCAVVAKLIVSYDRKSAAAAVLLLAQRQKEEEQERLRKQLEEQNAKVDKLLQELAAAKDEAQRTALQKQLEELQEAQKRLKRGMGGAPGKSCGCQPGDPLCVCP